jgi:alkyldihydroxyacetonephosphate synthase
MTQPRPNETRHMKWWGWGEDDIAFTHRDKPALAPFVRERLGVELDVSPAPAPGFDALDVPASRCSGSLRSKLVAAVGAAHVSDDAHDRVVHAYGKSLRDLVRVRRGELARVPDLVVTPGDEDDVAAVLRIALEEDAVVIPFGGGTNIVGSLEARADEARTILSVDLGRMDRVLDVDTEARLARVQAGVLGPSLETQLAARGFTLGHFPDSFAHSTLGGWVATRSSGMQSDKYGDIADITRGLRVVTPQGVLAVRPVPSTSTGPSVREMVLGSEGRLGIITEVTVQVHQVPAKRSILGYFFPTWPGALAAMRDIAASDVSASVTRVSDPNETQFSLATKKAPTLADRAKSAALKAYLRWRRGYDLERACLSFIGYEGDDAFVKQQRRAVGRIVAKHGGVCVGSSPGELYDQKKFDTPYIRDFLLDRGVYADVSETAAPWSMLRPLYDNVVAEAGKAFAAIGVRGWIMCHLSHSYHAGACLYFTFAFKPRAADGLAQYDLSQYDTVKAAIQQAFVDSGGTLSHHHGVGTEHARWLEQDISPAGASLIRTLFAGADPGGNLNPGKIVDGHTGKP